MTELDPFAVNALGLDFMKVVARYYRARPVAREAVFEVLNALAITAATVCRGTESGAARQFFRDAFTLQIGETTRD